MVHLEQRLEQLENEAKLRKHSPNSDSNEAENISPTLSHHDSVISMPSDSSSIQTNERTDAATTADSMIKEANNSEPAYMTYGNVGETPYHGRAAQRLDSLMVSLSSALFQACKWLTDRSLFTTLPPKVMRRRKTCRTSHSFPPTIPNFLA